MSTPLSPLEGLLLRLAGIPVSTEGLDDLPRNQALVLVAGRYEGVDERLIEAEVDEELRDLFAAVRAERS